MQTQQCDKAIVVLDIGASFIKETIFYNGSNTSIRETQETIEAMSNSHYNYPYDIQFAILSIPGTVDFSGLRYLGPINKIKGINEEWKSVLYKSREKIFSHPNKNYIRYPQKYVKEDLYNKIFGLEVNNVVLNDSLGIDQTNNNLLVELKAIDFLVIEVGVDALSALHAMLGDIPNRLIDPQQYNFSCRAMPQLPNYKHVLFKNIKKYYRTTSIYGLADNVMAAFACAILHPGPLGIVLSLGTAPALSAYRVFDNGTVAVSNLQHLLWLTLCIYKNQWVPLRYILYYQHENPSQWAEYILALVTYLDTIGIINKLIFYGGRVISYKNAITYVKYVKIILFKIRLCRKALPSMEIFVYDSVKQSAKDFSSVVKDLPNWDIISEFRSGIDISKRGWLAGGELLWLKKRHKINI